MHNTNAQNTCKTELKNTEEKKYEIIPSIIR